MNSPLLLKIKEVVIEGRRKTLGLETETVWFAPLRINIPILKHPSPPFHYFSLLIGGSGAWESQNRYEIVVFQNKVVWNCIRNVWVPKKAHPQTKRELAGVLDNCLPEKIDQLWLDSDCQIRRDKWLLDYQSEGFFDQYTGVGRVYKEEREVGTIFCVGGATG